MKKLFFVLIAVLELFVSGCSKTRTYTEKDGSTVITPFASGAYYFVPEDKKDSLKHKWINYEKANFQ